MQRMRSFLALAVCLTLALVTVMGCGKTEREQDDAVAESSAPAEAPEEPGDGSEMPPGVALEGMDVPEGGGSIYIESFPPGAMVVINGDPVGVRTPATLLAEAGHYEVRIELKGFTVTPEFLGTDVTEASVDTLSFQMAGEPMASFGVIGMPDKEVCPDWSPDGKKIVYEAYYGGNRDIYVIPITGGQPTRITFDQKADFAPCWSADGTEIVFTSNRGGTVDLWAVSANGGEPRRLTTGGGAEENATFSPDGKWIAFESRSKIWKIPAAGGKQEQVTTGEERHFYPDWSPDGKEIAFTAQVESGRQIWVVDVKSGDMRKIVSDKGWSYAPSWSPNGKVIAFVRRGGGTANNHDLWVAPSKGGQFTQLTLSAALDQHPSWSPDGDKIVWTKQADIWIMTNLPAWLIGEGELEES